MVTQIRRADTAARWAKTSRLRDAANYILDLPTETIGLPDWQLAMEALSLVSESGPTTLARLAFLKALNSNAQG